MEKVLKVLKVVLLLCGIFFAVDKAFQEVKEREGSGELFDIRSRYCPNGLILVQRCATSWEQFPLGLKLEKSPFTSFPIGSTLVCSGKETDNCKWIRYFARKARYLEIAPRLTVVMLEEDGCAQTFHDGVVSEVSAAQRAKVLSIIERR